MLSENFDIYAVAKVIGLSEKDIKSFIEIFKIVL